MLEFDKKTHNGIHYPSVTEVLPEQNFYCSEEKLEKEATKGSVNHELIRLYFEGNRNTFREPYLIAFDDFLIENNSFFGDFLQCEKRLFSEKHLFTGRPDLIFSKAIIDIKKSRGNSKYQALQLAGYNILAKENKILSRTVPWIIIYEKDGKFKMYNVYNELAEVTFLSLVKKYYIDQSVKQYFNN